MTTYTDNDGYPINRRDVLKSAAAAGAIGLVGIPALSGTAVASAHVTETIYLSHSTSDGGSNVTKLFTVDLDSSPGDAVLTEVTSLGAPFQNVDAIAATPDGASVVFVDRNTKHYGEYDVVADSFTDMGQVAGLPTITVLAAFGLDNELYVASNTTNKLYTVDDAVSPPVANEVGTITGATVNGADIVFDSTGTLFLHSNADDTLYTVDYQNPVNGTVAATPVGTDAGSSLTGLAVRAAGTGDLVGSSRADDAIVVLDKTDGSRTATYGMTLDGSPYAYTNGDMATGVIVDETCDECTDDGLVAKYEFDCVETALVDDEEICVVYDFVFETGDDALVSYAGDAYTSKDGEADEPITASFGTEYCSLWQVVKAGQDFVVRELTASDGTVTATNGDSKHAISFVAFFCTEAAAQAFADSFPSKGKGGGKPGRD